MTFNEGMQIDTSNASSSGGGGMGIGRTYGRRFAAEGASIVVADLDPEVGEREELVSNSDV